MWRHLPTKSVGFFFNFKVHNDGDDDDLCAEFFLECATKKVFKITNVDTTIQFFGLIVIVIAMGC